ncbi:hypothetical protein TUSST3_55670 [Streptomyces sp. TUS-ST3]|nr:hypothetical protein TUSST3_55670 [Streptomyces sp. TUS-ST3]
MAFSGRFCSTPAEALPVKVTARAAPLPVTAANLASRNVRLVVRGMGGLRGDVVIADMTSGVCRQRLASREADGRAFRQTGGGILPN